MADFVIGGVAYQSRIMDGETQTLVLKRLLPAFAGLMGCADVLKGAAAPSFAPEGDDADEASAKADARAAQRDALLPIARELAALEDVDVKFIFNACLDVTSRQSSGGGIGWVPVVQRSIVQDERDKAFETRLTIAWHVLGENFAQMLRSFGVDISDLVPAAPQG